MVCSIGRDLRLSKQFTEFASTDPVVPGRGSAAGRALLEGKIIHIPDVEADLEYNWVEGQKLGDFHQFSACR